MNATAEPEFSRPVRVDRVEKTDRPLHLTASVEERAALAERFRILEIGRLEADVHLRRQAGGRVVVAVDCEADVLQSCVVTLEPVAGRIAETFEVVVDPQAEARDDGEGDEIVVDAELDEDIEPAPNGWLDIGEVIAQYVALALDPYPRSPGAEAPVLEETEDEPERPERPFGALGDLARRKN